MTCACYQKSSLAAYSVTDQAVVADGLINFDVNRVLTGMSIQHTAGSATINLVKAGLYYVAFDGDFTITATGPVTFQLLVNGVVVPGAETTVQATTAVSTGVHFSTVIKRLPSCCAIDNNITLTVQVSAAGTLTNANITVVKEA